MTDAGAVLLSIYEPPSPGRQQSGGDAERGALAVATFRRLRRSSGPPPEPVRVDSSGLFAGLRGSASLGGPWRGGLVSVSSGWRSTSMWG
eukprot:743677-Pyramimonas_sp.AAC.1